MGTSVMRRVRSGHRTSTGTGPASSWWRSRGTLDTVPSGRANGFGLLRLLLAMSVVYSHAYPLGWNAQAPLAHFSGGQTDLGSMAVVGFFVLSGFMITASGRRLGLGRFLWHRALRILPGLLVCVLLTALVVAPLMYFHQHGTTTGFWNHPDGPLSYIQGTSTTAISSGYDISGVMHTAMVQHTTHNVAFDGALWSLRYELTCYVVVAVLAAGGVLRRAPRTVLLITAVLWASIAADLLKSAHPRGPFSEATAPILVPVLGGLQTHYLIYLGFCFMLGACAQLYRHRFPINDALGLLSAAVLVASLHWGGLAVVGYPACGYLLIWLGIRMPRQLHWVGRKNDYSYGAYIYGFIVEQWMTMYGATHWGLHRYVAVAAALTLGVAFLSWHLVERQALRLKDVPLPRRLARGRGPGGPGRAATGPVPAQPQPSQAR